MQQMEIEHNKSVDYGAFKQKPSDAQRYIIKRNLDSIVNSILKDIVEFQNTTQMKIKAIQQLKHVILLAQEEIQTHLGQILKVLARQLAQEEGIFQKDILLAASTLGSFIDAHMYIPILQKQLTEEEMRINLRTIANYLSIFHQLLRRETINSIGDQFENVIHLLSYVEQNFSENQEVVINLFHVVEHLIGMNHPSTPIYARQLFTFVLSVQSQANTPLKTKQALAELAKCCGYQSLSDLHTNEVNVLLEEIVQNRSYEHWKKGGKEFNKFQAIVYGCSEGIIKFFSQVLQIMSFCSQPSQDLELRMDILILLEFILGLPIQEQLKAYSSEILVKIVIPCMVWRVGKPQVKIRKGAVINAILLCNILSEKDIEINFQQIVAPLKSCLSDDWAPDLRYASTKLVERLLFVGKNTLKGDDLSDFYPSLLERLDDSQDMVRIEMAGAIAVFFSCAQLKLSQTIFEYMVKAILIHLDDQNEKVQRAVFDCLKVAATVNPQKVIQEAEPALKNFKHPRICQELLKFAQQEGEK